MTASRPSDPSLIRLAYRGESMRGTFAAGDCLWIARVPFGSLRPGDVVAFQGGGKMIAHRIAGPSGGGFLTRGDGALRNDSAPLDPAGWIGKVVERERRGIRAAVAGGAAGRRWALLQHGACRARSLLLFPLAPAYRLFRASRVASWVWRPRLLRVRFAGAGGGFVKYIHRGRTVACWASAERRWRCRKPYDLVLEPPGP